MSKTIFYIINFPERKIHVFLYLPEARQKEQELIDIYGARKTTLEEFPNLPEIKIPLYPVEFKTLKGYYGTVWVAYKFTESGACHLKIDDHWKNIKDRKDDGYKIQKFELEPYEDETAKYWIESNKQTITKKGYPGVTTTRRSPF